jgi:hypothetical protein
LWRYPKPSRNRAFAWIGINAIELSNLPAQESAAFDGLDCEVNNLLNEEDIMLAAETLQPNSSAGVLVFENVWATRLRDAIVNSGGHLVANARIPAGVVDSAWEAAQADTE